MPTLLQITVSSNWGSTGRIAEQIGLCAQGHGWNSFVAYGIESRPSDNKTLKVGSICEVLEHYAENFIMDNEGLASRISTRHLLKKIDTIKPDIVQIHILHDHWMNFRILFEYLVRKGIKVVWTQHDQWATTGHCMFSPPGCESWKNGCSDCPMKWSEYPQTLFRRTPRNWKIRRDTFAACNNLTIVAVSDWMADNIRMSHLGGCRLEVIKNGIELQAFRPRAEAPDSITIHAGKKMILGVASVWDARKGLKDFKALSQRLPEDEFEIVIVGKVPKKDRKPLPDGCSITYLERTQNVDELARIYSSASVFVNPTWQDNYPSTNLESLACGTPVITYRTGGSPEAVNWKTGRVVEQGDIDALAAAVKELVPCDMSEDCRLRAEALFDNRKCFDSYISLYENLLGE